MTNQVFIINGPNLNTLGTREPEIYGSTSLAEVEQRCKLLASDLKLSCRFLQSNYEGQIIDWLHEAARDNAAVIINPAGLSYHSVPIYDAVKLVKAPVVEVHITNIHARSGVYEKSIISMVAKGVICGLGVEGYELAMRSIASSVSY